MRRPISSPRATSCGCSPTACSWSASGVPILRRARAGGRGGAGSGGGRSTTASRSTFAVSTHATMLEAGTAADMAIPKLKAAAAAASRRPSSPCSRSPRRAGRRRSTPRSPLRRARHGRRHTGRRPGDRRRHGARARRADRGLPDRPGGPRERPQARGRTACRGPIGERLGRRVVTIRDDGVGFEGPGDPAGLGLQNMRRRAETIEGGLALRSRPGHGTASEVVLRA